MSFQVQKAQHPFSLFCQNLFHLSRHAEGTDTGKQVVMSLSNLTAMPKRSQMLLAYCIEQNNPELLMLDCDTDVAKPLAAGWFLPLPSATVGVRCFKIEPHAWHKLKDLGPNFLTTDLLRMLKTYRKQKSASYPWIW